MNYRFLASKGLNKFFEDSELSVGQIMRTITQEKFTGIKIENRSKFEELTDKDWNLIIEKTFNYEQE